MKVIDSESEILHERAATFAAGSMTAPELAEWEAALTDSKSLESLATSEFERSLLVLAADFEPVPPPPRIKAALLEAIAPPKGFLFRFANEVDFRPSPLPGISYRMLSRDLAQERVTCLLKLEPGARLPSHRHAGVEECMVLEGTVFVGKTRMKVGDYQRAEVDSDHAEQWTDTGALLYLSAPADLFQ